MIQCDWTDIKTQIDTYNLIYKVLDINTTYYIYCIDGPFILTCIIPQNGNADQTEFEADYLENANKALSDSSGRPITLNAIAPTGWTYQYLGIEIQSGILNGLYCKDKDGNNISGLSINFYDNAGVELVGGTQLELNLNCVETRVTYEPTNDYVLRCGNISVQSPPVNDFRVWAVAAPGIPYANGGSRVVINNLNLKYLGSNQTFVAEGRVGKTLPYSATLHTNRIVVYMKHSLLENTKLLFGFEMYKP